MKDELFALLKARYGDRLTPEREADLRKQVERLVKVAGKLRKVRLENGDAPFQPFVPYRSDD